jgi:dihydroxy-acid dehydratase
VESTSQSVFSGPARAPHRSLLHALGIAREDIGKPLIGIANSFNELVPGHMHLNTISQQVKFGVYQAGGIPLEFNVIGVCDGIAMNHEGMNYSLVSREIIADSVEIMAKAHGLDGLVLIPNCDKIIPGMVMAAARLDIPVVVVSGGPMLAGDYKGRKVSLSQIFEGVGKYFKGEISSDDLCELEESVCPTCGSCAGLFTANSMSCVTEALGLALPGDATIPAPYSARLILARKTGAAAVEVARSRYTARRYLTAASIRNALAVDAALGCSTNTVLHLLAIANEAQVELKLETFNEVADSTPNLVKISPAGSNHMEDLYRAGGVMGVMKRLAEAGLIDGSVPTVSGTDMAEQCRAAAIRDDEVIRPLDRPYQATGGLAVLFGNLAPAGAVVKESAVKPEMLVHRGPAQVFDDEPSLMAAIEADMVKRGSVVVVRNVGPKGAPGMPEMLSPTAALAGAGLDDGVALITDGDIISIDIPKRALNLEVDEEELARRRTAWQRPARELSGVLRRYVAFVCGAETGAVLGSGNSAS